MTIVSDRKMQLCVMKLLKCSKGF